MPKTLPPLLIIAKNQLASAAPWLCLLEWTLTDDTKIYIVHNTEAVTFQSNEYLPWPFQIEIPEIDAQGKVPSWTLRTGNANQMLMYYVEQQKGCVGATIIMRFVEAAHLTEDYTQFSTELTVLSSVASIEWITFTLGFPNPLRKKYPFYNHLANHCIWVKNFKGAECNYSGDATNCDGTLETCESYNNSLRFGGKIGMSNPRVRFA